MRVVPASILKQSSTDPIGKPSKHSRSTLLKVPVGDPGVVLERSRHFVTSCSEFSFANNHNHLYRHVTIL